MNTDLAQLFADRVTAALPFLAAEAGGRAVGLARLATSTTDEEHPRPVKLPVPVSYSATDCALSPRYLVPDADTGAILFFEDGGSAPLVSRAIPSYYGFRTASLTLLLWVNTPRQTPAPTETSLLLALERALQVGRRWSAGDYLDMVVRVRVQPAEASVFGRYAYADTALTPLLLPPYLVVGLVLSVEYRLRTCVPVVSTVVPYTVPFLVE